MKMTDNDTHSRLIDILISIQENEQTVNSLKRYMKKNHLSDEAAQRMEKEIKQFTANANNLKTEYNRLLATLKPF